MERLPCRQHQAFFGSPECHVCRANISGKPITIDRFLEALSLTTAFGEVQGCEHFFFLQTGTFRSEGVVCVVHKINWVPVACFSKLLLPKSPTKGTLPPCLPTCLLLRCLRVLVLQMCLLFCQCGRYFQMFIQKIPCARTKYFQQNTKRMNTFEHNYVFQNLIRYAKAMHQLEC